MESNFIFLADFLDFSAVLVLLLVCVSTEHLAGLVQERRNSSALAMELRLPCNKPSISLRAFFMLLWTYVQ